MVGFGANQTRETTLRLLAECFEIEIASYLGPTTINQSLYESGREGPGYCSTGWKRQVVSSRRRCAACSPCDVPCATPRRRHEHGAANR